MLAANQGDAHVRESRREAAVGPAYAEVVALGYFLGRLVRVDAELTYTQAQMERLHAQLREWFASHATLTVADLRGFTGASRKYAVPLLEHSDRVGWTARVGDERKWGGELNFAWPRDHDRLTTSPSDRGRVSDVSYSVDIEADHLICRSQRAAHEAAAIINGDAWMKRHLRVSVAEPTASASPDWWRLVIEEFDGCSWNEEASDRVWLAVRELLADGAAIELRNEDGGRYRIRWAGDRVVAALARATVWGEEYELT